MEKDNRRKKLYKRYKTTRRGQTAKNQDHTNQNKDKSQDRTIKETTKEQEITVQR